MSTQNIKSRIEIDFSDKIKNSIKTEESKASNGEIIQTTLLQMQNQYKIFHWQTTSYSQHKSFDDIVSDLSSHTDEFIETYMGKYGRIIASNTFNLALANLNGSNIISVTDTYINFLIGLSKVLDQSKDSDLLNIRDEMLGDLNKLKYLLTLS